MKKTNTLQLSLFYRLLSYAFIVLFLFSVRQLKAQRIFTAISFATADNRLTGGNSPKFLASGDFNNDGKQDLVITQTGSANLAIFPNSSNAGGSINFEAAINIAVGNSPSGVAVADLDGDGKLDIITVNGDRKLVILKNIHTSGPLTALSFQQSQLTIAGASGSYTVLVADLNADGMPDVVVSNQDFSPNPAYISVFQNNSAGANIAFLAQKDFNVGIHGSLPNFMAAGDLDNDGKIDLAITLGNSSQFSILRNNTGGTNVISFESELITGVGPQPRGIKIYDLDGDGKNEVIIVESNGTLIFKNITTNPGQIVLASSISIGTASHGLALVDLDGDGKMDVVTSHQADNKIYAYRSKITQGTIDANSFNTGVGYATNQLQLQDVIAVDLNNDSKPDLVAVNGFNSTMSIFVNNIDVTAPAAPVNFTAKSGSTKNILKWAANTENDLKAYKVYGGATPSPTTLLATINAPNATYIHEGLTNGVTYYYRITALDVATNESTFSLELSAAPQFPPLITGFSPQVGTIGATLTISGQNFSNNPAANLVFFGSIQAQVSAATTTQVTVTVPAGATYSPVTILNTETELSAASKSVFNVTYNNAIGKRFDQNSLLNGVAYAADARFPSALKIGDLDGDGKNDMIVGYSTGGTNYISAFRNKSVSGSIDQSSFDIKKDIQIGMLSKIIALGDVNGDGKLDLIAGEGAKINVMINTSVIGNISFAAPLEFNSNAFPSAIEIADIDLDGKPDIIVGRTTAKISILRNLTTDAGTVLFEPSFEITVGGPTSSLLIRDLDGDGKPEIVSVGIGNTVISILRNTSVPGILNVNSFEAFKQLANIQGSAITFGDYNADGKIDLAVTNFSSNGTNGISVFQNDSSPANLNFIRSDYSINGKPYAIETSDLDGDGKPDLVVASQNNVNLALLQNNTVGNTIGFESTIHKNSAGTIFLAADLDNDAKPELISYAGNNIQVYRNNLDYTAPATPANVTATADNLQNLINWDANTETDLQGYKVYWGTTNNPATLLTTINSPAHIYTHTGLIAGTTYYYKVVAFNVAAIESSASAVVASTIKLDQTLTLATSRTEIYGAADFDPQATSTNVTIPITYESSDLNIATIVNGKVHIVKAGTVTITAKQAGNATYNPAAAISQLLAIAKADQTLTLATSRTETYGAADFDTQATSTNVTIPITYESSDLNIATIVNGKVHIIKAGAVTITAKQAGNATYNPAAATNQLLTINKAAQVITVSATATLPFSRIPYDPAATSTNANHAIVYESSDASVATIVNGKVSLLKAGVVTITAKQAGDDNYTVATPVDQVLTITKINQAITFAAIPDRFEGDPDYDLGATTTAIGLNVSYTSDNTAVAAIVNGKLQVRGNGTANITASQAGDATYNAANPITRTVNVTYYDVTVTASGPLIFCAGGTVKFTAASGATSYKWYKNGTVINAQTTNILTVNETGSFEAELTFANGFMKKSQAQLVTVSTVTAQIDKIASTTVAKGTTLTLHALGGVTYSWANTNGIISGSNTSTLTIMPQETTTYRVTVTNAGGCSAVAEITITVMADPMLIINNVLTPNGDGANDKLEIKNIEQYPANEIRIFDRAGRTVYYKKSYKNDWDGIYNGNPLAKDTYYYILKLGEANKADLKGFITIIR